MYQTVLLPTDGSEAADAAVERAIDLATTYGADLRVVNVVDTAALPPDVSAGTVMENLESAGETVVADVAKRANEAGVENVETAVLVGSPHGSILDDAEEHDADVIVMGTHGRTGLDRYLLGSVTEKVVRLADVPVLTVRMPEEE